MILGELEKLVLNYLWQVREADAKQVHQYFEKRRGGSLNTIQSTLDRLHKKGLLRREKIAHAYHYRPAMDRTAFIGELIRSVTHDFSADTDSLMSAFVSLSAEQDERQLERLEAMIERYRQNKSKDDK